MAFGARSLIVNGTGQLATVRGLVAPLALKFSRSMLRTGIRKMLVGVRRMIEIDGTTATVRPAIKGWVGNGEALEAILMTGLALPVIQLGEVCVGAMMLNVAKAALQVVLIDVWTRKRIVPRASL